VWDGLWLARGELSRKMRPECPIPFLATTLLLCTVQAKLARAQSEVRMASDELAAAEQRAAAAADRHKANIAAQEAQVAAVLDQVRECAMDCLAGARLSSFDALKQRILTCSI
jgi:hypothetical protein